MSESEENQKFFSSTWESIGLDHFPVGLDYLVFECCRMVPRAVVDRWIHDVIASCNIEPAAVAGSGAKGPEVEVILRSIVWRWRRRQKALLRASESPYPMSNYITRVEKRAMDALNEYRSVV